MSETSTDNDKDLIEQVLKQERGNIAFEAPIDQSNAPINEPVIDKDKTSPGPPNLQEEKKEEKETENPASGNTKTQERTNIPPPPLDAPEQEINAQQTEPEQEDKPKEGGEGFTVPLEHAQLMADTILGVANNVLEVGGGYFITIRKHKDFYDFDEIIQIIDEQNVKNIRRLKLDEEDKALLRPLLIEVLRRQSKVMSVEQQLLGVALSIVIKKARVVMEIRSENEVMVDRIREVIRREVAAAAPKPTNARETVEHEEEEYEEEEEHEQQERETVVTEVTEFRRPPQAGYAQNGITAGVLETNPQEHN